MLVGLRREAHLARRLSFVVKIILFSFVLLPLSAAAVNGEEPLSLIHI